MTDVLIILIAFAQLFSAGLVLIFHQQFEVGQFKCVGILQASNSDAESVWNVCAGLKHHQRCDSSASQQCRTCCPVSCKIATLGSSACNSCPLVHWCAWPGLVAVHTLQAAQGGCLEFNPHAAALAEKPSEETKRIQFILENLVS